ncbi:unnamed protein product, partial [Mesorhabditis belari]|uniref:F-box domain-containing protein n=1 Tax=Mesorhabditis belari TaxID=2138241 RepID=A0AAF3F4I4_9BILA
MGSPSTSHSTFDIVYFSYLPWHVKREILSNLTPIDMLNLAEIDIEFRELIQSHPKRLHSIGTSNDLNIEVLRNGITRRYWRDYYSDTYHPKKIERFRREETQGYSLVFCAGDDRRYEQEQELLLSNCILDVFECPHPKHLSLGVVAKHLEKPEVDTAPQLIEMIDAFKAKEMNLIEMQHIFENNEAVDRFLENEKIRSLECLSLDISEANLHKFVDVKIPKLLLYVHDHTEELGAQLIAFAEQMIDQWEQGEREIDTLFLTLETDDDFGEDEIENILNFEINEMAHQLGFGRLGSFKEKTIDRRFRLIKRLDGTGLLIMTGAISVVLVKCDYAFRRERGLGTSSQFEIFHGRVEGLLYKLRTIEENEGRLRRYGKETVKEEMKEVVDSGSFAIFGIETLEEDADESEETLQERAKEKENEEVAEEEIKEEILADLEVALKELNEYRKNVPLRELSIDQLWDDKESQISKRTMRSLVYGLRGDAFPSRPDHDRRPDQRIVLEYADECLKAGHLLPYYETF